jgi:hypothetical protein
MLFICNNIIIDLNSVKIIKWKKERKKERKKKKKKKKKRKKEVKKQPTENQPEPLFNLVI